MCIDASERAQVQITGSLIVVPDVPTLMSPGELKAQVRRSLNTRRGGFWQHVRRF